MRLFLGLAAIAAFATLGVAWPALAQGSGMNCYANVGGRSNCGLAANALMNRLDGDPAERQAADARRLRQVRAVDEAIKAGRCDQAVVLARQSNDPLLSRSAARICAVAEAPDPGPAPGQRPN